jgi:hypothetical protein
MPRTGFIQRLYHPHDDGFGIQGFAWPSLLSMVWRLAAMLNAEKVPTRTPGWKWHTTQVQRIMGRAGR